MWRYRYERYAGILLSARSVETTLRKNVEKIFAYYRWVPQSLAPLHSASDDTYLPATDGNYNSLTSKAASRAHAQPR